MAFNPENYKIDEGEIRNLELVSQMDGYLQILRMNADWAALLEGRARLAEAVSSIGIEGTVLSLDQAKAITVGLDDAEVGEKERREFVGYYESLEYIKGRISERLTINLLLRIHEMVTRGDTNARPGRIRDDLRAIKSKGKVIYTAPPPEHLDVLLREFIDWFNRIAEDKHFSPIIAAALCHFWFVWIHPFCDGNGRVSRLLTTYMLLKKRSEGIRYFALSDYYNKYKDTYYDALERTNKCNPTTPALNFNEDLSFWLKYFVDSYLFQMQGVKEITNRILQLNIRVDKLRKDGLISSEGHDKVLSFLSSREKASYDELMYHLGVSKPRVSQILKPLREARILVEEKVGPLMWFKLGSPEDEPNEAALVPVKKTLNKKKGRNEKPLVEAATYQKTLPIFD